MLVWPIAMVYWMLTTKLYNTRNIETSSVWVIVAIYLPPRPSGLVGTNLPSSEITWWDLSKDKPWMLITTVSLRFLSSLVPILLLMLLTLMVVLVTGNILSTTTAVSSLVKDMVSGLTSLPRNSWTSIFLRIWVPLTTRPWRSSPNSPEVPKLLKALVFCLSTSLPRPKERLLLIEELRKKKI